MKAATIMLLTAAMVAIAVALPAKRANGQPAAVTDSNLQDAIKNAKTPADHEAIAAYFEQEASDAKKKAALHSTAQTYRTIKIAKPVYMAEM
jgi:hypothetical protein